MDLFLYKSAFFSLSIIISAFLVLIAEEKSHRIIITVLCIIQNLLSFFFFVYRDFPYTHPLLYFYLHGIWYIFVYYTIFKPKLR